MVQRNGRWTWLYREAGREILSNSTYSSRDGAERAAAAAYPDVELEAPNESEDASPENTRIDRLPLLALVLVVIAVVFVVWRRTRRAGYR